MDSCYSYYFNTWEDRQRGQLFNLLYNYHTTAKVILELGMYLLARLLPIISSKNWSKPHTLLGSFCQQVTYNQSM